MLCMLVCTAIVSWTSQEHQASRQQEGRHQVDQALLKQRHTATKRT